jgi:Zn-dependent oligopeptidase
MNPPCTKINSYMILNRFSKPSCITKLSASTELYVRNELSKLNTVENLPDLLLLLDGMSDKMCLISDSSECIRKLHPEIKWRRSAESAFEASSLLMNELNSSRSLASKFNLIVKNNSQILDSESNSVIQAFQKDFDIYNSMNDYEMEKINSLKRSIENYTDEFERISHQSAFAPERTDSSLKALEALIRLRFELAKTIGKSNPSELILRDKQLKTSDDVMKFLKDSQVKNLSEELDGVVPVVSNLENNINVLKRLARDLFNVDSEILPFKDFGGSLCIKFKLFEGSSNPRLLGTILFDLNVRRNKPNCPVHNTIQCKTTRRPGLILLSMGIHNFSRISLNESRSLFHEFGHALHSLLCENQFQSLSGTRGPIDLSEIPSTLFELIHDSPEVQDELKVSKISVSTNFNPREKEDEAFQLQIAALDQLLHSIEPDEAGWTRHLVHQVERDFPLKRPRQKDWHCSIGHFATYGGSYFAYTYSREMARRLWFSHFGKNPYNTIAGSVFKDKFLKKGGAVTDVDFIIKG